MGNISSPVITRLGIKQFWYKHFYADTNQTRIRNLKSNKLIITLMHIYLSYGIFFHKNFFISNFWFKSSYKSSKLKSLQHNYFRRYHYNNNALDFEYNYRLRNHSGEYFPLKVWVLKYKSWVVFSVNWFKPIKKKLNSAVRSSYNGSRLDATLNLITANKGQNIKRLKFLILFILKNIQRRVNIYNF